MSNPERPLWAMRLSERDFELSTRGVFTTHAASEYTGLSEGTIRKALKNNELAGAKLGKGWRIAKRDLNAFARIDEA